MSYISISVTYFTQLMLLELQKTDAFQLFLNANLHINYIFILTTGISVIIKDLHLNS